MDDDKLIDVEYTTTRHIPALGGLKEEGRREAIPADVARQLVEQGYAKRSVATTRTKIVDQPALPADAAQ